MRTETPWSADAFVNSIGVNTHFSWGPYDARFGQVKADLLALGVHHIRDGLEHYNPFYSHLVELGRAGVRATITTSLDTPMNSVATYPSYVPGVIESFEGPNEPNNASGWVSTVRTFQHNLYRTVKGTPATSAFSVLGPALAWRIGDWSILGSVSNDLDYGNMHDYFGGVNPGSGSIAFNLNGARHASGSKPVMTSETGYCTSWGNQAVNDDTMGKYVPRMFFEQYLNGIPRTLEYAFIDEDSGTYNLWLNCGLMRSDLTPKIAYYALKNVIGQLADPGPWFAPRPLSFSISDGSPDVHHALLQKRDGSYYLAIWLEDSDFNVPGGYQTNVASRSITVTFADVLRTARYTRLRPDGSSFTDSVTKSGHALSLMVSDSVSILRLTR